MTLFRVVELSPTDLLTMLPRIVLLVMLESCNVLLMTTNPEEGEVLMYFEPIAWKVSKLVTLKTRSNPELLTIWQMSPGQVS